MYSVPASQTNPGVQTGQSTDEPFVEEDEEGEEDEGDEEAEGEYHNLLLRVQNPSIMSFALLRRVICSRATLP